MTTTKTDEFLRMLTPQKRQGYQVCKQRGWVILTSWCLVEPPIKWGCMRYAGFKSGGHSGMIIQYTYETRGTMARQYLEVASECFKRYFVSKVPLLGLRA